MTIKWYEFCAQGLKIFLKVMPQANRTATHGLIDTPTGPALKLSVQAPPDKDKANKAVCTFLAGRLGVPKSRAKILHGQKNRYKTVLFAQVTTSELSESKLVEALLP